MQTDTAVAKTTLKYILPFLPISQWGKFIANTVFTYSEKKNLYDAYRRLYNDLSVNRAHLIALLVDLIVKKHIAKGNYTLDKNFLNCLVPCAVQLYKEELADAYLANKEKKAPQPKQQPISKEKIEDRKAYDAYIKSLKENPAPRVYKNNSFHDIYMHVKRKNKAAADAKYNKSSIKNKKVHTMKTNTNTKQVALAVAKEKYKQDVSDAEAFYKGEDVALAKAEARDRYKAAVANGS